MKKIVVLLLAVVLVITATGCSGASGKESSTTTTPPAPTQTPTPTPGPHEPTIALVIANQQFNYEEYAECRVLFILEEYKIITAGQQTRAAVSMDGQEVEVGTAIGSLTADEVNALIVIGGSGAPILYDDAALRALIQEVHAAGKPVGAICLAPVTLANASLLSGRDATVYPDETAIVTLTEAGANYIEDSDVVTANGPESVSEFAVAVRDLLDNGVTVP